MNFKLNATKKSEIHLRPEDRRLKRMRILESRTENRIPELQKDTDNHLVAFNGIKTALETVCDDRLAERLAVLWSEYEWFDSDRSLLAGDCVNGLSLAVANDFQKQVDYQLACFKRTLFCDLFSKIGLSPTRMHIDEYETRTVAEGFDDKNKAINGTYIYKDVIDSLGNSGATRLYVEFHDFDDNAPFRISNVGFTCLESLRRLPKGFVEDIYIAEEKAPPRISPAWYDKLDPMLVVQVGGKSYILCDWLE